MRTTQRKLRLIEKTPKPIKKSIFDISHGNDLMPQAPQLGLKTPITTGGSLIASHRTLENHPDVNPGKRVIDIERQLFDEYAAKVNDPSFNREHEIRLIKQGRFYKPPKPARPELVQELHKYNLPAPLEHNARVDQAWTTVLENVKLRRRFEELERRKIARIEDRKNQILD